jgi:hypothetical protein
MIDRMHGNLASSVALVLKARGNEVHVTNEHVASSC